MPLKILHLNSREVKDVSPLNGMPLKRLVLPSLATLEANESQVLRDMKSLRAIGLSGQAVMSAPEFWRKYEAGECKGKLARTKFGQAFAFYRKRLMFRFS